MSLTLPAVYLASLCGFIAAFVLLGIKGDCLTVVALSKDALARVQDRTIPDREKEAYVQKAALRMLRLFVVVTVKSAAALLAALLPAATAHYLQWASFAEMEAFALRADVLSITVAIFILAYLIKNRAGRHTHE